MNKLMHATSTWSCFSTLLSFHAQTITLNGNLILNGIMFCSFFTNQHSSVAFATHFLLFFMLAKQVVCEGTMMLRAIESHSDNIHVVGSLTILA